MQHILVITLSNLGDVIMTTPVMMALATRFPAAQLTVLVGPKAQALLTRSPHLYRVIPYDKKADWPTKGRLLRELRITRYDLVVDLRNTPIPYLLRCARRSPLFRHFRHTSMRERHWEILEMMGLNLPAPPPFQFFDAADSRTALEKLRVMGVIEADGWIVAAPGAASEKKRWPVASFQAVLGKLVAHTTRPVLLIGAPNERPIAEAAAHGLSGRVAVLCGETSLHETAALLAKAGLVIANDSAIMHLGFELDVPTVGIFGPTDHEKYGHIGEHFRMAYEDGTGCSCHAWELPDHERSCFHGLRVEKVLEQCWELLKASEKAR